jgi:hypothetical protein
VISVENGLQVGNLMAQESAELGQQYLRERKAAQLEKKVICRECRIKKRIQICSIQRKIGSAGIDSNGMCLGFESEKCKQCFACTSYEQKETL